MVIRSFSRDEGAAGGRHDGIDIVASRGSPVLAVASGVVIYAGSDLQGFGQMVVLRHRGDWVTVYARNRRNLVHRGQLVAQGEAVAEVGNTGGGGPRVYLHFEIRQREKVVNPSELLPDAPKTQR